MIATRGLRSPLKSFNIRNRSEEKSFGFGCSEKPKAEEVKAEEPKVEAKKEEAPKPTKKEKKVEAEKPAPAMTKKVEAEILYGAARLRAKRGRG